MLEGSVMPAAQFVALWHVWHVPHVVFIHVHPKNPKKRWHQILRQVLRCWANAYLGIDLAEEVPTDSPSRMSRVLFLWQPQSQVPGGVKALAADKELNLDTKVGSADLNCDILRKSAKLS